MSSLTQLDSGKTISASECQNKAILSSFIVESGGSGCLQLLGQVKILRRNYAWLAQTLNFLSKFSNNGISYHLKSSNILVALGNKLNLLMENAVHF